MTNDHVNNEDNITGETIKAQHLLIQIPIRELHNYLIQPPSEGGFYDARSESDELIIGDN